MALVLKDRVKELSTVTGTGSVTLAGPTSGYQSFNTAIPTGSQVYYCIAAQAGGQWEVGYGTFTAPSTLSRTSVFDSSSAGALVDFDAGVKDVFVTYPAEKAIYEETNGETLIDGGPITVVGSGVTSVPSLPAELGKFVADTDLFAQIYNINQNDGANASADFVAYNDLTTDGYTNFIDMGINSSNYSSVDYPLFTPGSGYLFNDGGTLFVGSQTSDVKLFAGGVDSNSVALTANGTTQKVTILNDGAVDGEFAAGANATVAGTVTIEGAAYSNAANITALNQLATKAYVDNATAAGLHIHEPVVVATTGNLVAVYDQPNGASNGIGATLTNNATQETIVIDNITLSANNRVLVYQQSNAVQNGVYIVTSPGNATTNWVLTRSSDADTSSQNDPNSLGGGDYFYVQSGDTQAGDSYVCTSEGNITFGTTLITFSQFSAAPTYTGTAPINVSGQTIALTGVVDATHGGTGANTVTTGDLLYGSASNTWSKLSLGSGYKSLVVNASGTQVEWNAVALNQSGAVSGTLPATNGGTGQSNYATGDILYSSATDTLSKLTGNQTTTKKFLGQTGTGSASQAPVWEQPAASDITGLAPSATTDTSNASNISSGTLPSARLSGSYTGITGVGTVTVGDWAANAVPVSYGGTGATNASTARTNLGLAIGANVQAYSATLQTVADLSSNGILARTAANTVTSNALTTGYIPFGNGTGAFGQSSSLFWDSSNNSLGIGTSSPATDLSIFGGTGASQGIIIQASGWPYNYRLGMNGASGGDVWSTTNYSVATASVDSASYATTFISQNVSGQILFGTGGVNTAPTERMRIDSSGNVGIGTSSPAAKLDVAGNIVLTGQSTADQFIRVGASRTGNGYSYIDLQGDTTYASGMRLIRTNVGANSASRVEHRGTGSLELVTIEAGPIAFQTTSVERARISAAGGFSVGTTADPGAGAIYATGNITAYYSSDRTLKENIKDVDGALDKVCAIGSKTFDWTDAYIASKGGEDGYFVQKSDFGVVAQDVQAVFPQAVRTRDDGTLAVDYEKLSTLAFGAIKELLKRVEALEAK